MGKRLNCFRRRFLLTLIGLVVPSVMTSCTSGYDPKGYESIVKSGFAQIPEALEIEKQYGEAQHAVSFHGSESLGHTWSTTVYLEGRYKLLMQVDVKLDPNRQRIQGVIGSPTFYLNEIKRTVLVDGERRRASYGRQTIFGRKEWKQIMADDGDFRSLGWTLKKGQPIEGAQEYIEYGLRDHVTVRP